MLPSFELLQERLLRAGVAPRRVRRYVLELREHFTDLAEHERAAGLTAGEARERALLLLGGEADLAQAMIQTAGHRSLAARAPWMVFVMWPVLLLVAAIFLSALLLIYLLWPVQGLTPAQMPDSYRILIGLAYVVVNYLLAGALSTGCIIIALRQRLTSGWIWAGLSLIAVFSGFLGVHMHVIPTANGHQGGVSYYVVETVYLHGLPNLAATVEVAAARATVMLAVAAAAYRVLQMRWIRVIP
ncbi:MAG TPA: hypothetical protein VIY90_00395 [Steroidobacteraceae bacterium]